MAVTTTPWWEEPDSTPADKEYLAQRIMQLADYLEREESARFTADRFHSLSWGGESYLYDRIAPTAGYARLNRPERLRYNIAFGVTDTLAPVVAGTQPRIRYLTNDADWGLRNRAKMRELIIHGEFDRNNMGELAPLTMTDAMVSGTGVATVVRRGGRPKIELSRSYEWRTDPNECEYTNEPLMFQRVRRIDRATLQQNTDVDISEVSCDVTRFNSLAMFDRAESNDYLDTVVLVETWRLALDEDTPGKYVAVTGDKLLSVKEYTSTRPPAAFLRWHPRQKGFWGQGIPEIVRSQQDSLNYLDAKIGEILHLASKVYLITQGMQGERLPEGVNNEPVSHIHIHGPAAPPQIVSRNVVPDELFRQRQEVLRVAFEMAGVSETRVASRKPAGVVSAVGQREANDIADSRQRPKMQRYERFHIDTARLVSRTKDNLLAEGIDKPVSVDVKRGRNTLRRMSTWRKAQLNPDSEHLTVDAASSLPLQASARRETLQEWFSAGLINRTEFMHLTDMPDLSSYVSLELADMEMTLDYIETIMEDGEQTYPQPTDNLALSRKLMTQASNKFRRLNAPQERLDMLDLHIDLARQLEDAAGAQGQPQQAPAQPEQVSQEQLLEAQAQAESAPLQ